MNKPNKPGVLGFIKNNFRTKKELLEPISLKDNMRLQLAVKVLEKYRGRKIHILNLPSVWWNFEKLVTWLAPQYGVTPYFTGCEWDTETFLAAAGRLPRRKSSFFKQGMRYNKHQNVVCAFSDAAVLINLDIFTYMKDFDMERGPRYDFIWLDLMSHVTSFHTSLPLINRVLKPGGMVTITYSLGREKWEIADTREDVIMKQLPNFELDYLGEYKEGGYPMRHITLIKK